MFGDCEACGRSDWLRFDPTVSKGRPTLCRHCYDLAEELHRDLVINESRGLAGEYDYRSSGSSSGSE